MKKEAMIVMVTCQKSKTRFGIRIEKQDEKYIMNWAFQMKEGAAKREGFENNTIKGNICMNDEYPGCPDCGAMTWFQCGLCKQFVCMQGDEKVVTCPDCGNKGELHYSEEFELKGGKI